jgi:hypothetical protein
VALSADEITNIRLLGGDLCADTTKEITTDPQIQAAYDNSGSECGAVVFVLRARLAKATQHTGVNKTTANAEANPAVQAIKDTLDYWQSICPEAMPVMGKSTIDLGIDEETAAS